MTVRVRDLKPGDVFLMDLMGGRGTVIITAPHPLYLDPVEQTMALVVWYLHDEERFSFDALLWIQEISGVIMAATPRERQVRLRHALMEGQQ